MLCARAAINRLNLLCNKKKSEVEKCRHEIKDLLERGAAAQGRARESLYEKAQIKAERVIREEDMSFAFDLLATQCDLLVTRFEFVEREKELVEDVKEIVLTLIWAAPRMTDVEELKFIREQLVRKYSRKVIEEHLKAETDDLQGQVCNVRIVSKLSYKRPDAAQVHSVLTDVARSVHHPREVPPPLGHRCGVQSLVQRLDLDAPLQEVADLIDHSQEGTG